VHLAAWLGDVAARPQHHFSVVGPEADLALDHDRVLVLPRVPVRRGEVADSERVLNDGDFSAVVTAVELVHGPESGDADAFPFSGLHHGDFWRAGRVHQASFLAG
jgi:hypothetical protein